MIVDNNAIFNLSNCLISAINCSSVSEIQLLFGCRNYYYVQKQLLPLLRKLGIISLCRFCRLDSNCIEIVFNCDRGKKYTFFYFNSNNKWIFRFQFHRSIESDFSFCSKYKYDYFTFYTFNKPEDRYVRNLFHYTQRLSEYTNIPIPENINLYIYNSQEQVIAMETNYGITGIFEPLTDNIYVIGYEYIEHELVHLFLSQLDGWPSQFVHEGMAGALSQQLERVNSDENVRCKLLSFIYNKKTTYNTDEYIYCCLLFNYLFKTYGSEKVLQLYRHDDGSYSDFLSLISKAFSCSVESILKTIFNDKQPFVWKKLF